MERDQKLREYATYLIRQHGEEEIEHLSIFEMFDGWHSQTFGTWPTDEDYDEYLCDEAAELHKLIDSANVEIMVTWDD
jgi:hypothetical protein